MGETRINLWHLLEDLRDSYPCPIEEAIITEIVANSLDSGASRIKFVTDFENKTLTIIDNGSGMGSKNFEEYHDIASSTKKKGRGIGFAGVGVKLALLLTNKIETETKKGNYHKSTRWYIKDKNHAPWEYIRPTYMVLGRSGTAIKIYLKSSGIKLLDVNFISNIILTNFLPILHPYFMDKILKRIYTKGIEILVNGKKVEYFEKNISKHREILIIKVGRKERPIGIGLIEKYKESIPEKEWGIAISTYGKVIKKGWDWLGLKIKNPDRITGLIEIPKLSEILTINKTDFLKDAISLQKYYKYRKAIQSEIIRILKLFGEYGSESEDRKKENKKLEKEIQFVLGDMLIQFPELKSILGLRGTMHKTNSIVKDEDGETSGEADHAIDGMEKEGENNGKNKTKMGIEKSNEEKKGKIIKKRKRAPGLMISYDDSDRNEIGWLIEDTLWINSGHNAYKKAASLKFEKYHELITVAVVLSNFIENGKSPNDFINQFLSNWGKEK